MSSPDSVAGLRGSEDSRTPAVRAAPVPLFGTSPAEGSSGPRTTGTPLASGVAAGIRRPQWTRWAIVAGLVAVVAGIYAQTRNFGFVSLDDPTYVSHNRNVLEGLTPATLKWAFSGTYFSNWAPLTLLSYLIDAELWGAIDPRGFLEPRGFHLTNAILHGVNAVLFFLGLDVLTGRRTPSALAAALFAVHPLHVETVAWIADRKDLLATTFGLLAIGAYARFGRKGGAGPLVLSLVCFAAALLCKQMLVTLPAALLLFDHWPLRRSFAPNPSASDSPGRHGDAAESDLRRPLPPWGRRLVEKIPFAVLAAGGTFAMFAAQGSSGAIQIEKAHPLWSRLAGAVLAYGTYLRKLVWPSDLCCYYPHPGIDVPLGATFVSGFVLVALSVLAWRFRRAAPWGIVCWCWFLGTLVPVVGLVQVGDQLLADRYAYVPAWGAYVAFAWGVDAAARAARPRLAAFVRGAGWTAVAVLVPLAWRQTATWRDSIALYEHALSIDPTIPIAHANLAVEYQYLGISESKEAAAAAEAGDAAEEARHRAESERLIAEAIRHNEAVLESKPQNAMVVYNLGTIESFRGNNRAAEELYRRALAIDDEYVTAWANLGGVLILQNRHEEARPCLEQALRLDPKNPFAQQMLAELIRVRGERPPK